LYATEWKPCLHGRIANDDCLARNMITQFRTVLDISLM